MHPHALPTVPKWEDRFPKKVRHLLMESIVTAAQEPSPPRPLAKYAMINKEWNEFFERHIFKRVHIGNAKLNDNAMISERTRIGRFGPVFRGKSVRISSLRHIRLDIQVPDYPDESIGKGKNKEQQDININEQQDYIFMKLVMELFSVLALWTATENPGITLELKVSCPKDDHTKQRFRNTKLRASQIPMTDQYRDIRKRAIKKLDSLCDQVLRSLNESTGADLATYFDFPPVPVVKTFAILRETTHAVFPRLLALLFKHSLTCVEKIILEKWRSRLKSSQTAWRQSFTNMVLELPNSLTDMQIFDEVHGELHMNRCRLLHDSPLAEAIVRAAQHLRSLSVCYAIDALDFFSVHRGNDNQAQRPLFPHLETLLLTQSLLRSGREKEDSLGLLARHATKVVQDMPRLRVMEIWNAGVGSGAAFKYESKIDRPNEPARIDFKHTWAAVDFQPVINAWRGALGALSTPKALVSGIFVVESCQHYIDFAKELGLGEIVLCAASKQEIESEKPVRSIRVPFYPRT